MNTYKRILNGDRFSIKGKQGVFRVDHDPEIGIMGIERFFESEKVAPLPEGLVHIADCQLVCQTHLLGTLVSVKVPLIHIYFDNLSYDEELPF